MSADSLVKLSTWLAEGARSASTPEIYVSELCERLVGCGVPLSRVGLFVRTLHPNVLARGFIWRRGEEVVTAAVDFDFRESDDFRGSPLSVLYETGREARHVLAEDASSNSPFLHDLVAEGVTDYIAMPLIFSNGDVHAISWTTKGPGGFTDAHLSMLRHIIPLSARVTEIIALRRITVTLLDTYVGNQAGERILAGQIRRGHTESMNAAIWLSDLRGFTRMSDRLPPETVVKMLNRYFDCQVPTILEHGGEVLKFMGDGLLAVFPIGNADVRQVCGRVMEAARDVRANVDAIDYADGLEMVDRLQFGLALHVGTVLYGNIGGGNRLDFTCIGPAVNLAARLEKLTGKLNRTVVASREFARHFSSGWTDLGEFAVTGFAAAERVYGAACEERVSG